MKENLKKLNSRQLQAVQHQDGPLLVVAGAGTGKTTVLINRLAYLVLEKGVKTDEIILTTFTEKSAQEMIERADKILPYGYLDLWISTFHGLGERILRQHGIDIGLDSDFKLIDSTAQWVFLKKNIHSLNLKYYHSAGNPNKFIGDLISHFSRLKDENISSAEYIDQAEKISKMAVGPEEEMEASRIKELSQAYTKYNQLLLENNFLDFGDLITYSIKLFKERPNILKIYQDKFKYLMVDEFQDTNYAQYELIKILAGKSENLMVVGDDDQSIYKFRGASLSNIMQFKDDYPKSQEIILNDNYRSRPEILKCAHSFIRHNDPNRLEFKLKIDKKLNSALKFSNPRPAISGHSFLNQSDELSFVAAQIKAIHQEEPDTSWLDFAILTRTNKVAEDFSTELNRLGIPNHFVSLKGLYYKPIILDIISYFKLLDNYKESSALYRVLNMEEFKIPNIDLINLISFANKKYYSLFEALKNADKVPNLSSEAFAPINKLLKLIEEHLPLASEKNPSYVFIKFINDSQILKNLNPDIDREIFSYITQVNQKIKRFEELGPDLRLRDFMETLDLELEAGDLGSLKNDFADVDTVKVMTIHSAKGLEFKYVFLVNLNERHFPSDNRADRISLHPSLIKDKFSDEKSFHIEEERRLFYVALTRAREALFLSNFKDLGAKREKRPSAFIKEAGIEMMESSEINFAELEFLKDLKILNEKPEDKEENIDYKLPSYFSFSQLAAFSSCPLQYKYAHILKVPSFLDKPSMTFGRLIHNTLYNFLLPLLANNNLQADLFSDLKSEEDIKKNLSFDNLLFWYNKFWQDDGYGSQERRDEYRARGLSIMKTFHQDLFNNPWPNIYFLEKDFRFKFQDFLIKGKIDRVDKIADNSFEIIDYKTGESKNKLKTEDKRQLILYKVVAEASFGIKVDKLSYYYLEDGNKLSFTAQEKDIEKMEKWLIDSVAEIRKKQFLPNPGDYSCGFCDFNTICEFRQ